MTNLLYFYFVGDVYSFLGNQTHKDHFKLLQMDGSSLLIGARNVIYNLSINDLTENDDQVGTSFIYLQALLKALNRIYATELVSEQDN